MPIEITKHIEIDIECVPENPVALYWLNKSSNWDMWLFGKTQTHGVQIEGGDTFEKFIEDLADANARRKYISKTEIPQIVLGYSNLSTSKVNGVKGILSAIDVVMFLGYKDIANPSPFGARTIRVPNFIHVLVEPGSFQTIETENGFHNLEFTISLPEIFNQEQ